MKTWFIICRGADIQINEARAFVVPRSEGKRGRLFDSHAGTMRAGGLLGTLRHADIGRRFTSLH